MAPIQYERHVSKIIKKIPFFNGFMITNNAKFDGIKQPGKYQIDIAIKNKCNNLGLLFIVECKNLKRNIDRPIVQKFIQTKDSISAQKAIIVSPKGFSNEAINVAKANGIALWIIKQDKFKQRLKNAWDFITVVTPLIMSFNKYLFFNSFFR